MSDNLYKLSLTFNLFEPESLQVFQIPRAGEISKVHDLKYPP